MLLRDWLFPNTYCLSKTLAERMVLQHHSRGLPVAVVRPSIIGGLMGEPYPGFSGNAAGATGAALAIASGGAVANRMLVQLGQAPTVFTALPSLLQKGPKALRLPWPQVCPRLAACSVRVDGARSGTY